MAARDYRRDLEQIAESNHFVDDAYRLLEEWQKHAAEAEVFDPILEFMETHPALDFGAPGPLVHFMEDVARSFYDSYTLAIRNSLARRPTGATVALLNRIINGARSAEERRELVELMGQLRNHPAATETARAQASSHYERLR